MVGHENLKYHGPNVYKNLHVNFTDCHSDFMALILCMLQVYGAEGLSGQKLHMYFEHSRSRGGDVESVDILTDAKCAIVTFDRFGGKSNEF